MYKVSVIVPTYNVEIYLAQAIDSLISQTIFADIEVIIINDGSTDNSLTIAQQYADRYANIKVVTQENGGYGVAMNAGLNLAQGEYIGILEPDDFLASQMYEDLYKVAEKYDHSVPIVRATAIYKVWLKNGKEIDDIAYTKLAKYARWDISFDTKDYLVSLNSTNYNIYYTTPVVWNSIYRRSFLEKYQIKFSTIKAGYQDAPFFIETTFCADKIALLDNAYYYYRVARKGSSTQGKANKGFVLFELNRFVEDRLNHHNPKKFKLLSNNLAVRFYISLLWGYNDLISEDRKIEYLEQLKAYIIDYENRNKETFNLKAFNQFKWINDEKYNDVELLVYKGSDYFNRKFSSKKFGKLYKLVRIFWEIIKQPLFFIVVLVRLFINLIKQFVVLTSNLRIKHVK